MSRSVPCHILVFRFSALGDIAMTIPVIRLLLQQYPDLRITFVSAPFVAPLFQDMERLDFFPADVKEAFRGMKGLYRLSRQLKKHGPYDAIADLHDVLRTKILRAFFPGVPKAVIDKGRSEKKELTRAINKKLRPLKTTFQRYADVFASLQLPVVMDIKKGIQHRARNWGLFPFGMTDRKVIGVAPFARHEAKMYPLDRMKEVVHQLAERYKVILFGSRAEAAVLEEWENDMPEVYVVAGKYDFSEELFILSGLDLMISMDSANMHLASLYGVPVISIWGGTHPYLGFYGWGQEMDRAIQVDNPLRPSSVFGNKPCEGCMDGIAPALIVSRAEQVLRSLQQA